MANGQTTQNTPFFNPDPISTQDYLSGPVDFYSQSLGQATGIQVTDPNADDKDEKEEDTAPNIFAPIGADDRGREDMSTLSVGLQKGLETNPEETFKSFGVSDVNVDALKGGYTDAGFFSEQTGDLVGGFFSDFGSNLDTIKNKSTSIGNLFDEGFSGALKGFGTGVTAEKPFGEGLATISAPPAALMAMGPYGTFFGGLAALGGAANMAIQKQNAAAYKATGAGFIGEINGMMVSRKAGNFSYSGNLSFMGQEQVKNLEAISKGYLVGTMTAETYEDGKWSKTGGVEDIIDSKDVFKSGGSFSETGVWTDLSGQGYSMPTKQNVQDYTNAINSKYGSNLTSSQISNAMKSVKTDFNLFGGGGRKNRTVTEGTPTGQQLVQDLISNDLDQQGKFGGDTESQTFAEKLREESLVDQMTSKTSKSVLGKTTGNTALDRYIEQSVAKQKAAFAAEEQAAAAAAKAEQEAKALADLQKQKGYSDSVSKAQKDFGQYGDGSGGGGGGKSESDRTKDTGGSSPGDKSTWAEGGRVGMQAGGEAGFAQRPEFVGGNETPTDRQSIADDKPREVPEGTFVINAAAVDFAGREDIEKMVREAYAKAGDLGQTGVSQEIGIAVSEGEVLIPPHIAKIIGYDRLNKINNRGKKEISRRQEERQQAAGGGFIGRKKFAEGDRVTVYRGEPLDPSKVNATDYGYGKEDVGKFHTPDVKRAGRFAAGAGKGNQVIKSRKVTIDELFDGVEEAWKTQAKKKTDYFAKMPKSELNKSIRFVRTLKKDYLAGKRSLESMAMFLQEQVFQDDKSKINFIETFKNDPKSAGKLAGRALTKVATKGTPPLAILGVAAEIFTPSQLGDATLNNNSFLDYSFTPSK